MRRDLHVRQIENTPGLVLLESAASARVRNGSGRDWGILRESFSRIAPSVRLSLVRQGIWLHSAGLKSLGKLLCELLIEIVHHNRRFHVAATRLVQEQVGLLANPCGFRMLRCWRHMHLAGLNESIEILFLAAILRAPSSRVPSSRFRVLQRIPRSHANATSYGVTTIELLLCSPAGHFKCR